MKRFYSLLLIAVISFSNFVHGEAIARVMKSNGDAMLKALGKTTFSTVVKPGLGINNGDAIRIGETGFAVIIYIDDRSVVKIRENTEFQFIDSPSTRTLEIKQGTNFNNVSPQHDKTFIVATPVSVASVKGTEYVNAFSKLFVTSVKGAEFAVLSDPVGIDQFFCQEGTFDVYNTVSGETINVQSGQQAISNALGTLTQQPFNPDDYPEEPDEVAFEEKRTIYPRPTLPADLALDIQFSEPSGNNYLDAEETGTVSISITNYGLGEAYALQPSLHVKTSITGLNTGNFELIEKLDPSSIKKMQTTISASQSISSETVEFEINVSEHNGFDLYPPGKLTIQTRALVPPALALMDVGINDLNNYNGRIEPNEVIEATAIIQNRGQGLAKNVNISVHYGDNVFNAGDAGTYFTLGNIKPNETKDISFSFFANRKAQTDLPIQLEIKEARGKYDQTVNADLSLNEVIKKAAEVFVAGKEQGMIQITDVDAISVDIEKDIPKSKTVNKNALGVIFGIENYKNISPVTFANRDAAFIKEYFENVLGIPKNRIYYKTDSDVGQAEFSKVFSKDGWLDKRIKESKTNVFFYYAGHGAPDMKQNKAYLIPYDGDPNYASQTGYEMDALYEQLGGLGAASVTVFLDACFSGANRDNEMLLADARPVFMEVESSAAVNVTVFSAAGGKEISSAWPEKKHGLFSYYLMKGMRGDADANKDNQITVGELGDYVKENVSDMAGMLDREQTPVLQTMDLEKVLIHY